MIEDLRIRENIEEREESLSPHAVRSKNSYGRKLNEESDPIRTVFQRDRDRIIHSKAFRRLKHKTQVFIAPRGDHYVTRLTHTLEVSQVARTLSRSLDLNEDLTEAIAMGHDLGHTPFGHIGEEVLNELYKKGFRHNEQSLRVVDVLENEGKGLNLSKEVRDGILHHSKSTEKILEGWEKMDTFEGEVCRIADSIAYINHDIDDAIRAGIIKGEDLPESASAILGSSRRKRINTMVLDIIEQSWAVSGKIPGKPAISMSEAVRQATNTLRDFLFARVYNPNVNREESQKARQTIRYLYGHFRENSHKLPPEYLVYSDEPEQCVVDYISGMTDQFATDLAEGLQK
ncbi:MAG: deoxyguanosinetriphosphate triphosphohydrolase [Dehalococcoidales bacterium]|nr:deoxyguanosinetriphosphate triphosphohydrolase [Dehalococcoidales bacterium]